MLVGPTELSDQFFKERKIFKEREKSRMVPRFLFPVSRRN